MEISQPAIVSLSDSIAFLALAVSFLALGWNIIRDLFMDRVKLEVRATVGGEMLYSDGSGKGFFRDADSTFIPPNPKVAVYFTNTGRRPMVVSKIHGKYRRGTKERKKQKWILGARDLPKTLQPYETGVELIEYIENSKFIDDIYDGIVDNIFVEDTKGHCWPLSRSAKKRLRHTASLVVRARQKLV